MIGIALLGLPGLVFRVLRAGGGCWGRDDGRSSSSLAGFPAKCPPRCFSIHVPAVSQILRAQDGRERRRVKRELRRILIFRVCPARWLPAPRKSLVFSSLLIRYGLAALIAEQEEQLALSFKELANDRAFLAQ